MRSRMKIMDWGCFQTARRGIVDDAGLGWLPSIPRSGSRKLRFVVRIPQKVAFFRDVQVYPVAAGRECMAATQRKWPSGSCGIGAVQVLVKKKSLTSQN